MCRRRVYCSWQISKIRDVRVCNANGQLMDWKSMVSTSESSNGLSITWFCPPVDLLRCLFVSCICMHAIPTANSRAEKAWITNQKPDFHTAELWDKGLSDKFWVRSGAYRSWRSILNQSINKRKLRIRETGKERLRKYLCCRDCLWIKVFSPYNLIFIKQNRQMVNSLGCLMFQYYVGVACSRLIYIGWSIV